MKRYRNILRALGAAMIVGATLALAIAYAARIAFPEPALRCILTLGPPMYGPRCHAASIRVQLENRTGKTIHLPQAIEGSDGGSRYYPRCDLQAFVPAGTTMTWIDVVPPVDYHVRGVIVSDFHEVLPDAVFNLLDPDTSNGFSIVPVGIDLPPGAHRLRFVYRTNPATEEGWVPSSLDWNPAPTPTPELLDRIRRTPRGELISNEVVVTVPPAPKNAPNAPSTTNAPSPHPPKANASRSRERGPAARGRLHKTKTPAKLG
ncbi:MAG: hypothetical protein GY851_06985 [bacterium]|nr:hypothetical protein [bacterium]